MVGIWIDGIVDVSIVVNEAMFDTAFSVPLRHRRVVTEAALASAAFVEHHSCFTNAGGSPVGARRALITVDDAAAFGDCARGGELLSAGERT